MLRKKIQELLKNISSDLDKTNLELRKKHNFYKNLFNSIDVLLFVTDEKIDESNIFKTKFIKANKHACYKLGYSEEELTSKPFSEFFYESKQLTDIRDLIIETDTSKYDISNISTTYIKKNGDLIQLEWRTQIYDGEKYIHVAIDVTERCKIRESLLYHTQILDSQPYIIIATGLNDIIHYMNKKAVDIIGREFIGKIILNKLNYINNKFELKENEETFYFIKSPIIVNHKTLGFVYTQTN